MTDYDFIIELYCRVDEVLQDVPKHPLAKLYPSEIVTLGILFAFKGSMGQRAFYRWLVCNFMSLFPRLPGVPFCFVCSSPIKLGHAAAGAAAF